MPSARRALALALLSPLALTLSACGDPSYHYVKNSGDKTYFRVPAEWHEIDEKSLNSALNDTDPDSATAEVIDKITWSVAYDADAKPSAAHLLGLGSDQPFVYATVRRLTDPEQGTISLNHLRDLFLPVTETSRQTASDNGTGLRGFELLRDELLTPGHGVRGVRTTYNYSAALGGLQTFDLTAYASDDGHLYWMIVRCSAKCFKDRKSELDAIAESFTVRNT
ncbi:hypothetical protein [Actinocorallia longicatena]|uniref:Lipoprotein LpqN n=1 Tax=Actinocorallia longicatena TaxID=111803 RepID=A0ABP6QBB3_9ACTN